MKDIVTRDNVKVKFDWVETNGAKANVILCHGITANRREYNDLFIDIESRLVQEKFNSIRFDFRGHGESDINQNEMTVLGEKEDLKAVFNFVEDKNNLPIYILAVSFGAVATVLFSTEFTKRVNGIVFWNPVLDMKRTFINPGSEWASKFFNTRALASIKQNKGLLLEKYHIGEHLFNEMNNISLKQLFEKIDIPTIVFHGDLDDMVQCSLSREFSQLNKKCDFRLVEGEKHGFGTKISRVLDETFMWIEKKLSNGK